jgi:uncharacterized membrane protein
MQISSSRPILTFLVVCLAEIPSRLASSLDGNHFDPISSALPVRRIGEAVPRGSSKVPEPSANQVPRARVQALSDLVFGLALSIGALALINQQPHDLSQLSFSLFGFAFSFLILVNVWYRYSTIMSVLPVETPGLMALNLLMLFFVSVEPYLLNLLIFQTSTYAAVGEYASIFYALDITGLNLIVGWFLHALANEEKRLVPKDLLRHYRLLRNFMFTGAIVLVLSLLPFWIWRIGGLPVRFVMWVATLPLGWVVRFARRPSRNLP